MIFFPSTAKQCTSLHVLVVDDESLIRWSLAEALAGSGHTVTEASDGETALHALTSGTELPDVVLLDYRLPDSNDLTLLSRIRQLAPRSRVILMTAYGTPELVKGALELGAYRIVSKPFQLHELAALAEEAHGSYPE